MTQWQVHELSVWFEHLMDHWS